MADFTADVAQLENLKAELKSLGSRADEIASSVNSIGNSLGGIRSLANKGYPAKIGVASGSISKAAEGTRTASARMGRIAEAYRQCETEAKAAIVDSAMENSSDRLSNALRSVVESLCEDVEIQQGKGVSNSFVMNVIKSYVEDGIGKVEGIENIVDMATSPNKDDGIYEDFKSSYGVVAGIIGLPSFLPDAMDRGEARNKRAQDWVTKVTKEHGLGWGIAATVPAALWELGDFLLAEVPHCAAFTVSYMVKKQVAAATEITTRAKNLNALMGSRVLVQPSSSVTNFLKTNAMYEGGKKIADTLWRGFTGKKMPGYVDAAQDQIDKGVSRVTSRLIKAANNAPGSGGSIGSR